MIKHLYDIFAEKWYHKGQIWIYSDPHFGDTDCYKLRFANLFKLPINLILDLVDVYKKNNVDILDAFKNIALSMVTQNIKQSVEDELKLTQLLDELQIKNINAKCGKNDTLIILGDVGNIECVKKLKAGYKVLILGNHDRGASNYKRVNQAKEVIFKADIKGNPIKSSYVEDNYLFDEVYEGTLQIGPKLILSHEPIEYLYCLNIHGHVHNVNPLGAYTEGINCTSHYNCCAEQINYSPVSISNIIKCGGLKTVQDIHRHAIDRAVERKHKKQEQKN